MSNASQGLPKVAWEWVLFIGAVLAIVIGLFMFLQDTSGFPEDVARDVKIVAVTLILGGGIVRLLSVKALDIAGLRWALLAVASIVTLIALAGMLLQVVTPVAMVAPVFFVFGTLMMFRQVRIQQIAKDKASND
ncbi:hypothetical protein [Corynebacterium sp. H113]|uniref:hypothetical protein n=1 Tax=Corynebacterium sp. H113 TaxID=3133419 RepID=UPI0030B14B35